MKHGPGGVLHALSWRPCNVGVGVCHILLCMYFQNASALHCTSSVGPSGQPACSGCLQWLLDYFALQAPAAHSQSFGGQELLAAAYSVWHLEHQDR